MNDELNQKIAQLETRLNKIEQALFGEPIVAEKFISRREVSSPPPAPVAKPEAIPKPAQTQTEGSSASRILGFVAVLCFVGAATFLIKLAITSGWLTPERQVALAGFFGVGLIGTGLWFRTRDAAYLSLLSAAGIVVLELAATGGHLFYGLYSAEVSVAAVAVISVISIYCYSVFRAEIYAIISVLGAYASLFLLVAEVEPITLTTYYLVWDLAFAWVALSFRSRILTLLAAYMGLAGYHFKVVGFAFPRTEILWIVVTVQAIQFLIFTVSSVLYSVRHKKPFTDLEAWAFFPLLLFFYGIEYFLISSESPRLAPWVAVGFGAFLYFLYFSAKARLGGGRLESSALVASFGSVVLLHAVYFHLLNERVQLWVGPAVILLTPYLWNKLKLGLEHRAYWLVAAAIAYFSLFRVIFSHTYSWELVGLHGAFFAAFSLLYFGGRAQKESKSLGGNEAVVFFLLVLAVAQFMLGSYRGLALMGDELAFVASFRPFWVSSLWGIFGLLTLLYARSRKDVILAKGALTLMVLTTLKVFLFDVASSSPLIRISCLMIMGAVLYAGGYVLRTVNTWEKK